MRAWITDFSSFVAAVPAALMSHDGVEEVAGGSETAADSNAFVPETCTIYCSIPGHRQARMETALAVS